MQSQIIGLEIIGVGVKIIGVGVTGRGNYSDPAI